MLMLGDFGWKWDHRCCDATLGGLSSGGTAPNGLLVGLLVAGFVLISWSAPVAWGQSVSQDLAQVSSPMRTSTQKASEQRNTKEQTSKTQTSEKQASQKLMQQQREKRFREQLRNVELVGSWTIDGQDKAPKKDRYTISSVEKSLGNTWVINARIQYGDKDITLPVAVQVRWAGDTPVLMLTDVTLPGLGTFTVRLMVYKDHYAGYWRHDEVTGHMWGTIRKR